MSNATYLAQFTALESGTHMVMPPDCTGSGYDIACQPREDLSAEILAACPAGSTVDAIRANGFLCGYRVVVPEAGEVVALVQHSGSFGPWYHRSVYRRDPATKSGYVFIASLGGHFNGRRAKQAGLPIGRPDRRLPQYAY